MATHTGRMGFWAILAAALFASAVSARAADPATTPEKGSGDDAKWAELLKGSLTIYLEGETKMPFAMDVTFDRRVRIADKEYVLFKDKNGGTLIIRTQQIVAVQARPAK